MALADILKTTTTLNSKDLSEERIAESVKNNLGEYQKMIAYFRVYPDILVDILKGPNSSFQLYFYQRLFLRAVMRHRYFYAVFPRAFSKSFLSFLCLLLKCILYPGSNVFITSGGKEQGAEIAKAKVEELCELIPGLKNEIVWKKTSFLRDVVRVTFKNGSTLANVVASENSRGTRKHAGLFEECVGIDQDILNEVLIPIMNISRYVNGKFKPEEILNKSQIYITTAGYKNTFSYKKLIQILVQQVVDSKQSWIMGGTWRVPVMEKLLDKDFVKTLKLDGTFNETSFAREYESEWSGDSESSFFSSDSFDKHRVLRLAEHERDKDMGKNDYYVLSVDVGRLGCSTEVSVIKVRPQLQGAAIKSLVNLFSYEAEHFGKQAIHIKKLYYKYKPKVIVVDANGLGAGLVDFMIIEQQDEDGQVYKPFGIVNDPEGKYRDYNRQPNLEKNAMFLLKADQTINTIAHAYTQTQIDNGKVKFLIDEVQAKSKLLGMKRGQAMSMSQRAAYLRPYTLTTILKDQMMNLIESSEGKQIVLKQANRSITKDKFSSFEYGLYYIKTEVEDKRKKEKSSLADMMFMTKR